MSLHVRFLFPACISGDAWRVESCSWEAVGGPHEATLGLAEAGGADWMQLARLPGAPLELWDEQSGLPAWWGYVTAVEVRRGALCQEFSLEGLANRVAVSYLQRAAGQSGGRPAQTDWREDGISIGLYGLHERVVAAGEISAARAVALRDVTLARLAHPLPAGGWLSESPGEGCQIRLRGRGWWHILEGRTLALPAARAECRALGPGVQMLGVNTASQKAAQLITPASTGWQAQEVWLQVRKQGSPGDALKVELAMDNGGIPGSVVGSAQVAGNSLPADFRWVCLALAAPPTVSAPLWLVISRTGSLNGAHHYRLRVDETCSYPGGVLKLWNGSGWAARTPAADLTFRLAGEVETSQQMLRLAQAGIPPLSGVQLWGASVVFCDPYCSGLRPVRAELEDLLSGGAGGVRWLARVSPQRQVIFSAQPPAENPRLRLAADGSLCLAQGGTPACPSDPLAGEWAAIGSGSPLFLERVRWQAGKGLTAS